MGNWCSKERVSSSLTSVTKFIKMNYKIELPKLGRNENIKFESKMIHANPFKYSTNEDLRWLLWLIEAQRWLRINYKLYVQPQLIEDTETISESFEVIVASLFKQSYLSESYKKSFKTYEDALAEGIYLSFIEILSLKQ